MPLHQRHIRLSKTKLTVNFARYDLLYTATLVSPYDRIIYKTPLLSVENQAKKKYYVAPNILDTIEKVTLNTRSELDQYGFHEYKKQTIWRFRPHDQYFASPLELEQREISRTKKGWGLAVNPFTSGLNTGGQLCDSQFDIGNIPFTWIVKASSCSISSLVYQLAISMYQNDATKVHNYIQKKANEYWLEDLQRAVSLYQYIASKNGFIKHSEIKQKFLAQNTISQLIETNLLEQACYWMGQDPNQPVPKNPRGRPKKDPNQPVIIAGNYIETTIIEEKNILDDGTVEIVDNLSGRLIAKISDYQPDTDLSDLTLQDLVFILSELQEINSQKDIDLMEAYLEALNPDWREDVFLDDESLYDEDPYTILGVSPEDDLSTIKAKYFQLLRIVHPDTSSLPDWITKRIIAAYEDICAEKEAS